MTNIDIDTVPVFYRNYVKQVMHMDAFEAMERSRSELNHLISTIAPDKENYAYADGKWTVKELLCHIIDAERIFTYRALCFSRNDRNNLPGFDENAYVPESNAPQRSLLSIQRELDNLRASTIDFFKSCSEEMFTRRGIANNTEISVSALAYIVSGHAMHHVNILKQRYLA
jgi:uncharacterized damage-inducible protein DinB